MYRKCLECWVEGLGFLFREKRFERIKYKLCLFFMKPEALNCEGVFRKLSWPPRNGRKGFAAGILGVGFRFRAGGYGM